MAIYSTKHRNLRSQILNKYLINDQGQEVHQEKLQNKSLENQNDFHSDQQ